MTDPARPTRDRADIAEAIRGLTAVQWLRLRKVALAYARLAADMDPDDLLQEAFRRALDGERTCPADVDVVRFLAEAIRSIADGERAKNSRRPATVRFPGHGGDPQEIAEPAEPMPDAEESLIEGENHSQRRAEAVAMFEDDIAAQTIVEGILDNMRGEELRELTGLDETTYESKRRLIRRRIEKRKGVKP